MRGSDARPWTIGHPGGPRRDVNGIDWYACDPYPTWYRYAGGGSVAELEVGNPVWPSEAGDMPNTKTLQEFRKEYAADDNAWWRASGGELQNVFDEALELIEWYEAKAAEK